MIETIIVSSTIIGYIGVLLPSDAVGAAGKMGETSMFICGVVALDLATFPFALLMQTVYYSHKAGESNDDAVMSLIRPSWKYFIVPMGMVFCIGMCVVKIITHVVLQPPSILLLLPVNIIPLFMVKLEVLKIHNLIMNRAYVVV
jgi:hypothetical protein